MEKIGQLPAGKRHGTSAIAGVPASSSPLLLAVGILVGSAILSWSAYQGRADLLLALVVAGAGFLLLVSRPEFGIFILISTMLLTYPDILAGHGLLTINNLLGLTFVVLLLSKVFFGQELWFLRERETQLFLALVLLFFLFTGVAEYLLPKLQYMPLMQDRVGRLSPAKDITVGRLKDFLSRVAFFVFLVNFITSRGHLRSVLLTVLVCILFVVPAAFQTYMSGQGADFRVTAGFSIGEGSGWLSNPNRFAFMCLVGISLLYYFAASTSRRSIKLAAIPLAGVLAALVLLSGSRSGFISLILSGGWVLMRARGLSHGLRASILLLGIAVVITFFLFLPPLVQERLLNLNPFNPEGEGTHSTQVRTATLAESLTLFAKYPLSGVGVGNFRWLNLHFHNNFKPPHNSYLWALAEGGIFGFLIYLLLFSTLWKRLYRLRQTLATTDPALSYLASWLSFYLVIFLFFSCFADIWLEEIHLYLIAGLSLVLQRLASVHTAARQPEPA